MFSSSFASWPVCRFFRRQVRWSGTPICLTIFQFFVIHTVKGFSIVNEAEVGIFLEFLCFIHDPMDVGNLISAYSASLKPSLYICKFSVHVPLKPNLKNFEHNLAIKWNKCNSMVSWTCLAFLFLGIGMKTDLFQSCGHCWDFQICWHIDCNTLTASSFRIWNSSARIPSPSLALFTVMLPKAQLKKLKK